MFATEEWVCSLTAIRSARSRGAPRWCAVSRATASAERFAAEPPCTKQPPALGGSPARSARNRNVWFSACTAPAASSHEMPDSDDADTTVSKRSDALVGAAGMNARNRGLSQEMTASDSTSWYCCITTSGSLPSGRIRLGACSSSSTPRRRGRGGPALRAGALSVYANTARAMRSVKAS